MTKVGFMSLGCPKNLVATAKCMLAGNLRLKGFTNHPQSRRGRGGGGQAPAGSSRAPEGEHRGHSPGRGLQADRCLRKLVWPDAWWSATRDQLLADMPEIDACLGTRDIEHIAEVVGASDRLFEARAEPGLPL